MILFEPELHIGGGIVVPDIAGWREERLPVIPESAFFTVVPDWVCEVISKSTERIDRAEKMPWYAAIGVNHAWLVHPRQKTLEAYRLANRMWLYVAAHKDDERARIEPFEAIELDLATLWRRLPYPTTASEPSSEWEYERALP